MASRDDLSLPSTSNPFHPFADRFTKPEKNQSAWPKYLTEPSNLVKKPESKSADETEFMTYIGTFGSPLCCHAVRFEPGQELRKSLLAFVQRKKLKAPFIMSCVGSAKSAKLRMANATAEDPHYLLDLQGAFEIISLSGTFSADGRCHLHVSLANETGKMHGGHLVELIIRTTAEVIIGECSAMVFEREHDPRTGFPELVVKDR